MTSTSPPRPVVAGKSPPAKKPKTQQRRYGFACSNCRRRKAKCNGEYPACDKCLNSKEECSYDKGPSVAYAVSLQNQLRVYETCFEQLRNATTEERLSLLEDIILKDKASAVQGKNLSSDQAPPELDEGTAGGHNRSSLADNDRTEQPDETSIGVDGSICFYGKTSLYHVEPQEDGDGPTLPQDDALHTDHPSAEHHDSSSGAPYTTSPVFFSGLDSTLDSLKAEVSSETLNELMTAYWCLPHHLHLVLCKRLFLRDLLSAGPYMTPFLLSSVLAQAARYCNRAGSAQIGNHFASRALQLLPQDIDRGSQIPTIQGLLILSSREVACGRVAQGWLYSGMAFRMMRDLGLHVPSKKLGYLARHFSDEDHALRHQVFWSCYTWDKAMSLCLGRAPIIHDTLDFPTPVTILDGKAGDEELWVPNASPDDAMKSFLTQRALSSVRFAAYCELATIIDDVLDVLYSRPHRGREAHLLDYLASALQKLERWSSKLPRDLFMQSDCRTAICPPLHILLLNLTYHATTILLCRPYRNNSQRARASCTEAARMIDFLFTLHVRRFGFKYITYLQTYTMFVACTINVLDFQENGMNNESEDSQQAVKNQLFAEASARLDFGLQVLRQAGSTPSAARCAAIIARLLKKKSDDESPSNQQIVEQPSTGSLPEQTCCIAPGDAPGVQANHGFQGANGTGRGQNQSKTAVYGHGAGTPQASMQQQPEQGFVQGLSLSQSANPPLLPITQSQLSPVAAFDGYQPRQASSGIQSRGNFDFMGDHNGTGVIETPLRWLPENMQDDGSWMLMIDNDPNYMFMANYQP